MRFVLITVVILVAAVAGFAVHIGLGGPIGVITISDAPANPSRFSDWSAALANPVDLRITAFVTGWVEAGPEILIDKTNPRTPEMYKKKLWVPSVAYLVEHPTKGAVLLDTGLKAGDCAYGTPPLYWVPCRNTKGSDAVSQLAAKGLKPSDLAAIVVSHFHGDHVSGLGALLECGARRVVTSGPEVNGVESALRILSGYEASMLKTGFDAVLVDRMLQPMPIVGRAADFFGDGSLWLIPTPGHTEGQLSALINTKPAPLLLTFDASHLKVGFDENVIPGAYVDRAAAERSLAKLRALAAAYPQLKVIYGHEPSQWEGVVTRLLSGQDAPTASR